MSGVTKEKKKYTNVQTCLSIIFPSRTILKEFIGERSYARYNTYTCSITPLKPSTKLGAVSKAIFTYFKEASISN